MSQKEGQEPRKEPERRSPGIARRSQEPLGEGARSPGRSQKEGKEDLGEVKPLVEPP
jgi:hypothetical protein